MSPKPDVSKQRTAQIIEAATSVFASKGFDHATMEDIADKAGINKATIYLYFDNKDALVRAIAEAVFARELADLQAAHDLPGTATERLTAYYKALTAQEAGVLPVMPVLYEFYALGLRREDVRAVIAGFIGRATGLLEGIIRQGIESGEFAATDARQAAHALDALLSGTILHWVFAPEKLDPTEQLRYGVRLVFHGLLDHS